VKESARIREVSCWRAAGLSGRPSQQASGLARAMQAADAGPDVWQAGQTAGEANTV